MRSPRRRRRISFACSRAYLASRDLNMALLEVTMLGCGSSTGVPRLGGADGRGDWGACDPANPKNRRRRCSILLRRKQEGGETCILVDTSPDLREQLLSAGTT